MKEPLEATIQDIMLFIGRRCGLEGAFNIRDVPPDSLQRLEDGEWIEMSTIHKGWAYLTEKGQHVLMLIHKRPLSSFYES